MDRSRLNALTGRIIGACIEVHKALGPGLLESTYETCVCHELTLAGILFERQRPVPVFYKGTLLDCGYRLDLVVDNSVVVDLKSVEHLLPIHEAQVLTYLGLASMPVGLLVNFNTPLLHRSIKRFVNDP